MDVLGFLRTLDSLREKRIDHMNKRQVAQYLLLNDAAKMNQTKVINQLKQTAFGDREIVFERAQALGRRGVDLSPLLVCLKATFKQSEVIRG